MIWTCTLNLSIHHYIKPSWQISSTWLGRLTFNKLLVMVFHAYQSQSTLFKNHWKSALWFILKDRTNENTFWDYPIFNSFQIRVWVLWYPCCCIQQGYISQLQLVNIIYLIYVSISWKTSLKHHNPNNF